MTIRQLGLLLTLCSGLFAIGLFAPCMTVVPGFGELTALVQILKPDLSAPSSVSIAESIVILYREGKVFIGSVVLIFSVLFPTWKLGVLWNGWIALFCGDSPQHELQLIEKVGKFSMLDIFVIALLVLAIKGLPGGTAVQLRWGVYAFTVSVALSLLLPRWIKSVSQGLSSNPS